MMLDRTRPKNLRQQVIREKKRKNIVFFTIIVLASLYMGSTLLVGETGLVRYFELKSTERNLATEVKDIKKEHEAIKKQMEALRNDPFYIEKHAREEFGLARPGEYIFKFKDDDR